MPELDGIGVVRELSPEELPGIVFVTAYDRYAIAAFDLHAVDYVLKPVQARRFSVALDRARRRLEGDRPGELVRRIERLLGEYGAPGGAPDRILVRSGSKAFFVKVADLQWLEASGNYVRLHTPARDPRALVRETLAHLAAWLPSNFLRVHRSAIVNLDAVTEVRTLPSGDGEILLRSGVRVGLSRRYQRVLQARVGPPR
jgi:two-component system LytT family response regulator